ncbi:MAG: AEC family transporter [Clostridia bacterium]|nr:AEC family transporter [Clostridia bacterium]
MFDAFFIMLKNVAVFVALAMPGFILVKTKLLSQEHSGVMSKFLMYVGLPFMIVTSVVNKVVFSPSTLAVIGVAVAVGVVFTLLAFFMSKPTVLMEKDAKKQGMMRFCSVFSNNGFLGIPLAAAVFPSQPTVVLVVIIINIITNVMLYTLGVYAVTGDGKSMNIKKALINPVIIAFIVGVVINLTGVVQYVPEINTFSTHFSSVVTPLSMTILGMKMGSVKISSLFLEIRTYYVSALKLIVYPVIIVALMLLCKTLCVPFINTEFVLGIFMAFSMPTAGLASAFADTYDGDGEGAVKYTLNSTILSVITIPVLYLLITLLV